MESSATERVFREDADQQTSYSGGISGRKEKEILAENRYLLTGKRSQEKEREGEYDWFQEEVPVYRYQSAEIILQKVTGRMELKEKVVADTSVRGMIGVYSPIHRIGKTKLLFVLRGSWEEVSRYYT